MAVPGKGALLVVLEIRGYKECNGKLYASGDRRYMAADIVAVVAPVIAATPKHTPARDNKMPAISKRLFRVIARSTSHPRHCEASRGFVRSMLKQSSE